MNSYIKIFHFLHTHRLVNIQSIEYIAGYKDIGKLDLNISILTIKIYFYNAVEDCDDCYTLDLTPNEIKSNAWLRYCSNAYDEIEKLIYSDQERMELYDAGYDESEYGH